MQRRPYRTPGVLISSPESSSSCHNGCESSLSTTTKLNTQRRKKNVNHPSAVFATRKGKKLAIGIFVIFGVVVLVGVHVKLFLGLTALEKVNDAQTTRIRGKVDGDGGSSAEGLSEPRPQSNTDTTESLEKKEKNADVVVLNAELVAPDLAPLTENDRTLYTIRMNTWKRNEQLLLSLDHHSRCPGVALIQVIWCDLSEGNYPAPPEIANHSSGKVVVEYHDVNSLNERFNIINDPPTKGILSLDDDVLRPCAALDAGFFRWTSHPDRMVGYDARLHIEPDGDNSPWEYGYLSSVEKQRRYSLTLPRAAFLHRDYLNLYMTSLPRPIFDTVAKEFNCEDIAMSFMVSSVTGGKPPLLADLWAVKTVVKLYSPSMISTGDNHKVKRDHCVDEFATILGLKDESSGKRLQTAKTMHWPNVFFRYGAEPDNNEWKISNNIQGNDTKTTDKEKKGGIIPRFVDLAEEVQKLKKKKDNEILASIKYLALQISDVAIKQGLVEGTKEWKKRWSDKEQSK